MSAETGTSIERDLMVVVDNQLRANGTNEVRIAVTRGLLEAGFFPEARASVALLVPHAATAWDWSTVAVLAARAGDRETAAKAAAQADAALRKPGEDDDLTVGHVAAAYELLDDHTHAEAIVARLDEQDRPASVRVVVEQLARAGKAAQAEAWAKRATREQRTRLWLEVARAHARAGDKKAARAALVKVVDAAGKSADPLADAADVYAQLGEGKVALGIARKLAEPRMREENGADFGPLVRAALAGKDRELARRLLTYARQRLDVTLSPEVSVQIARLYLVEGVEAFKGTSTDARQVGDEILQGVEAAVAAQGSEVIRDGARAALARARLTEPTGRPEENVARAMVHASEIRDAGTRMTAYIAIAAYCQQHPVVETEDIRRAFALVRHDR